MYYGNRIMKAFREKLIMFYSDLSTFLTMCRDPKHVQWVNAFKAILEEMRIYVMEYHTTGLAWNPKVRL
jgi:adenylyl cyclase-associated protein